MHSSTQNGAKFFFPHKTPSLYSRSESERPLAPPIFDADLQQNTPLLPCSWEIATASVGQSSNPGWNSVPEVAPKQSATTVEIQTAGDRCSQEGDIPAQSQFNQGRILGYCTLCSDDDNGRDSVKRYTMGTKKRGPPFLFHGLPISSRLMQIIMY